MEKIESLRHQMQIARRKNVTKVKPCGKVYYRTKLKDNE